MTIQFSRIFSLIANPSAHETAIRMMGSIPVIFTTRVWICISSFTQSISIFGFLQKVTNSYNKDKFFAKN
jgi:hypothetical protein